jgi:hypothetical protein
VRPASHICLYFAIRFVRPYGADPCLVWHVPTESAALKLAYAPPTPRCLRSRGGARQIPAFRSCRSESVTVRSPLHADQELPPGS